jgi:hypothetical protein
MNPSQLLEILRETASGRLSAEGALERLRHLPFEEIPNARIDHHRALRQGFPEAVLCEGKDPGEAVAIVSRIAASGGTVIATRVAPSLWAQIEADVPRMTYNAFGRVAFRAAGDAPPVAGRVLIVTGGSSDRPVAEEAAATLEALRVSHERSYDVGVAGIHRVLADRERLARADALIVAAGMEGALASVVGGLVAAPVIAVPTSIGYGATFGGVTALLAMLSTCAQGVTVVNIDNGFGAACAAHRILAGRAGAQGGGSTDAAP